MSVIKVNTKGNKYSAIENKEEKLAIAPVEVRFIEPTFKSTIKKNTRKPRKSTRADGTNPRAKGTNPRAKSIINITQ